jgi:hypothetical protein
MSMPRETQTDLYAKGEVPLALRTSERLRKGVDFIGRCAAWLLVPLVLITVIDVVARKLTWHSADGVQGVQIWLVATFGRIFESTLLQELEWHFHTALFALVLGFVVPGPRLEPPERRREDGERQPHADQYCPARHAPLPASVASQASAQDLASARTRAM